MSNKRTPAPDDASTVNLAALRREQDRRTRGPRAHREHTKPNEHEIAEMILTTARQQVATTTEGKAITAAGLGRMLDQLVTAIAGNVALIVHSLSEEE